MIDPYRIAAAEYAWDGFTAERLESPYGVFVHNLVLDNRVHATGLQFARCLDAQLPEFLANLEANYKRHPYTHRWITGFDPRSLAYLSSGLLPLGFTSEVYWALVKSLPSSREINDALTVRVAAPFQDEGFATVQLEDTDAEGVAYQRTMLHKLEGREVVVYDGETPIASGGYYVFEGITRFSRIVTRAEHRGRGAATALIETVCQQPEVASSDAIVLCVGENGPLKLYESLGFTRNNFFFNFSK
jgi:GNAT superfamily N-acetyltransferase